MRQLRSVLAPAMMIVAAGVATCSLDREGAEVADTGLGVGGAASSASATQASTSASGSTASSASGSQGGSWMGVGGGTESAGGRPPQGSGGDGGTMMPPPTCADAYPGFVTCSETSEHCEIIALNGPVSCAATCESFGGTCSGAYDNYPAGSCSNASNVECDTTGFVDLVCTCSLGGG